MNDFKTHKKTQAILIGAIDDFVSRLELTYRIARVQVGSGGNSARRDLAELRRALHGRAVSGRGREAHSHRYVTPSLRGMSEPEQERVIFWFYTVGSLFALHPSSLKENSEDPNAPVFGKTTFGKTCGRLCKQSHSASLETRFIALLSSDAGEAQTHLRQLIAIMRSHEQPLRVNWRLLLHDLTEWNKDSGSVQRKWGRHFYIEAGESIHKSGSKDADVPDELPDETDDDEELENF